MEESTMTIGAEPAERVFRPIDRPTLHHVCLFVPDMPTSTRFYVDGIGLAVREAFDDIIGRRPGDDLPFGVASIFLEGGDGRYVELHLAGEGTMSPSSFPLNHLAFADADVDAAYERALRAGAKTFGFDLAAGRWDGAPLDVDMRGIARSRCE